MNFGVTEKTFRICKQRKAASRWRKISGWLFGRTQYRVIFIRDQFSLFTDHRQRNVHLFSDLGIQLAHQLRVWMRLMQIVQGGYKNMLYSNKKVSSGTFFGFTKTFAEIFSSSVVIPANRYRHLFTRYS